MNCPKCAGKALERFSVPFKDKNSQDGKIDLDRCGGCGGTWFDKGEVDQYLKTRTEDAPSAGLASIVGQAQDSKPGQCPRCSIPLAKDASRANAAISVDRCGKCSGVWFDGGELQRAGKSQGAPNQDELKTFFSGF